MNLNFLNESSLFNECPSQENYNIPFNSKQYGGGNYYNQNTKKMVEEQQQMQNYMTQNEEAEIKNDPYERLFNIDSICELEKQVRSLEVEISVEKLKKDNFKSLLDLKKKQNEGRKVEIKKIKMAIDKMKDQINILSRENEFLNDMIQLNSASRE